MAATLVRVYGLLEVPEVNEAVFGELAEWLSEIGDDAIRTHLRDGDFELAIRVAEGSARIRLGVFAGIGWVAAALAGYDGVFAGIERLEAHSRSVGNAVRSSLREERTPVQQVRRVSVDTADVRRLRQVLELVSDGTLRPEAGLEGVLRIVETEDEVVSSDLLERLRESLKNVEMEVPADVLKVAPRYKHIQDLDAAHRSDVSQGATAPTARPKRERPKLVVELNRTVHVPPARQ